MDGDGPDDPFTVLGLDRRAGVGEIRAARRRLAFDAHPDRGGDAHRMQALNAAFDAAIAHATGRRPLTPHRGDPGHRDAHGRRDDHGRRAMRDAPSFVIEALPVEAYEALLVVTTWIGDLLVDEPPYLLEAHLFAPYPCWCRLDLVPDAGASTVSIVVVGLDDAPAPPVEAIRDLWVECLNGLGGVGT